MIRDAAVNDPVFKQVTLGQPIRVHAEQALQGAVGKVVSAADLKAKEILEAAEADAQALVQEARAIVEAAHQRAAAIEADALAQREAVFESTRQEAQAQGMELGLSQGYEAAALETMELLQAATTLMEGVKKTEAQRLIAMEPLAVQLMQAVLKAASRVVWERVPHHVLVEAWQEAVRIHGIKGESTLLIHPAQIQMLEALGEDAQQLLTRMPGVALKTDATLAVDATYLLHSETNLNLTLASLLENLCRTLFNKKA
jgi:flagellar biosynthesis/type III secretory pathway protein FliH